MTDPSPQTTSLSTRARKLWLIAGLSLLAIVVIYSIYWWVVSKRALDALDLWVQKQQLAGYAVQWDGLRVSGYPFRLVAVMEQPGVVKVPDGAVNEQLAWSWSVDALTLSGHPWQWRKLRIEAPGRHRVEFSENLNEPARTVFLDAGAMVIDAAFIRGGHIKEIKMAGSDLVLEENQRMVSQLGKLSGELSRIVPAGAEADERTKSAAATIDLRNLDIPVIDEALARVVGTVVRQAALKLEIYGLLPVDLTPGSLSRWRDQGGVAEVRKALVDYGPLSMDADGTLALGKDLQPVGSFVARLQGYSQAIDMLEGTGLIGGGDALAAKLVLGAMAETDSVTGISHLSVPITIQDGTVYAGPLALTRMPPVEW